MEGLRLMANLRNIAVALILTLLVGAPVLTETVMAETLTISKHPNQTSITAYQGPMSLFQQTYKVSLPAGPQIINITDLPGSIVPETIMLDGTDAIKIASFSYAKSDITPRDLLSKLIGQNIGWATRNQKTGLDVIRSGELISVSAGIIIKFPGGIELDPPGHPVIDGWPEGAILGDGIRVMADAQKGTSPLTLGYLAGGLGWQTSYVIMLEGEANTAKFDGIMTVVNQTGSDFKQAKIRLVAGHVNMTQPSVVLRGGQMEMLSASMNDGISENPAFDTHIYNLDGQFDINNGAMLAIPFIASDELQIRKRYVLEGYVRGNPEPSSESGAFVTPEIRFSLKNDKAAGLGKALPAGTVRVMAVRDGAPMLLGEDRISHTPTGETINLRTGRAFDVTAKRKQVIFRKGSDHSNFNAGYEIILKNTKSTGVVVDVIEHLPGKWKITTETIRHVKRDIATAIWSVPVPANGQVTLSYAMETHR